MTTQAERSRRWRKKYPGRQNACSKAWRQRNPEHVKRLGRAGYEKLINSKEGMARFMIYKARERGREEVTITPADVLAIWPADDKCPVFGWQFFYGRRGGMQPAAPSLDRIDPKRGYVKGNIAVVSWRANALKRDGVLAEFKQIVAWLERME